MWLYAGGFLLQGAIALLVVIAAFGGSQVGVSLGGHASKRTAKLAYQDVCDNKNTIDQAVCVFRELPSPFPEQYLLGIDEQQLDMERGYPTYLLGTWYPDGSWWWIFPPY